MASNIPCVFSHLFVFSFELMRFAETRRATRTARTTVLKDENANANPRSRIVTHSKPPSTSNHTTQPSIPIRLTALTLSTRAKALTKDAQLEDPAQGKRKRPVQLDSPEV